MPSVARDPIRVAILDAFAPNLDAYRGNPGAVVLSAEPLDEATRTNLAKEFHQPAIAFVSHPEINDPDALATSSIPPLIRWHAASGVSLPLCGHATMVASVYLLDHVAPNLNEIRYQFLLPLVDPHGVKSEMTCELSASRCKDGRIEITLPASSAARPLPVEARESVLETLRSATGLEPRFVEAICLSPSNEPGTDNLTIELSPEVDLETLEVDSPKFLAIPYRGIYITSASLPTSKTHYRCRVFFPSVGILEDHVCGSANTLLGPYWIEKRANTESPLPEVVEVHQVSPRGGLFALRWDGKWGEQGGQVALRGKAKLIMEGQMRV